MGNVGLVVETIVIGNVEKNKNKQCENALYITIEVIAQSVTGGNTHAKN